MKLHLACFVALLITIATSASAQTWRIVTPEESELISSNTGERILFPNVLLAAGLRYRVRASNAAKTSNANDSCDARYYFTSGVGILPNPIFPNVGLKIRYDGVNESFFQPPIAVPIQNGYQRSHIYDASVLSRGTILGFRFFDRVDPPSSYYDDNRDFIAINVARETPGIAVYRDTLDFGSIATQTTSTLPDSIESYGRESLNVTSVNVTGSTAFSFTSERGPAFSLAESLTNSFAVSFAPTQFGPATGELHIHTSNGFGQDTDRIIYLIGTGRGASLSRTPDTLDFGVVPLGKPKTLNESISNLGNSDASFVSATITANNVGMSVPLLPLTISAASTANLPVTFQPVAIGPVLVRIDAMTADGSVVEFYAKGNGAQGTIYLSADTLDFGTVLFNTSKALTDTMTNIGSVPLSIESVTNTSPGEFGVIGNTSPRQVAPGGSGDVYTVTFTPLVHTANFIHTALLIFTYDGGQTRTVYLIGREHTPLEADLRIDTTYFETAGSDVTVYQRLTSDLAGTVTPVRDIQEKIFFDPKVVALQSVAKGGLLSANDWALTTSTLTSGEIDITVHATQSRLSGIGSVLLLRFHVLESAKDGDFTTLPQQNVALGGGPEPTVVVSPGIIHVIGECGPVQIQSGNIATSIEPATPNPASASTTIRYWIKEPGATTHARISIYNQLGILIQTVVDGDMSNGEHTIRLDTHDLENGMYTYIFEAAGLHIARTMIVVK